MSTAQERDVNYLTGATIIFMPEAASRDLNLWKQQLGQVPEWVWNRVEAETLVLADNGLTCISGHVCGMQSLRMLDLGHNQLTYLPEELGSLTGLRDFLYLHDNQLNALPAALSRLTRLRYLNISENRFEELPECVCAMAGLIELRLSDNRLAVLPESVGNLSKLRELHLRNNQVTTLPQSLGNLRELRQIDLRGNPIRTLPDVIATLPRLEKIDLRWVTTLAAPVWLDELEERGCAVYR